MRGFRPTSIRNKSTLVISNYVDYLFAAANRNSFTAVTLNGCESVDLISITARK